MTSVYHLQYLKAGRSSLVLNNTNYSLAFTHTCSYFYAGWDALVLCTYRCMQMRLSLPCVRCPSLLTSCCYRVVWDMYQIRNEVVGKDPFEVELQAGSFYWGDHLANPIVHKVKKTINEGRVDGLYLSRCFSCTAVITCQLWLGAGKHGAFYVYGGKIPHVVPFRFPLTISLRCTLQAANKM